MIWIVACRAVLHCLKEGSELRILSNNMVTLVSIPVVAQDDKFGAALPHAILPGKNHGESNFS